MSLKLTDCLPRESVMADLDWQMLCSEAYELGRREPVLADILLRYFPDEGTFAQCLALRLADSLQSTCLPVSVLSGLFEELLARHPHLEQAALDDLQATRSRDPSCDSYLHIFLNLKGFLALQIQRLSHVLWHEGRKEVGLWLSNRVSVVIGVDIHPAARIGAGVMLDHASGLVIGETAVVEDQVSILQNVTLGGTGKENGDRHPKVRQGVMVGAGSKIIGNIEIGANSKVAAGSVVLKDVPANCTVAGIPAQIVRIHNVTAVPADTMDQLI